MLIQWRLGHGQTASAQRECFWCSCEGGQLPPQVACGPGRVGGLFGPNEPSFSCLRITGSCNVSN
jgi:hypothetical protein